MNPSTTFVSSASSSTQIDLAVLADSTDDDPVYSSFTLERLTDILGELGESLPADSTRGSLIQLFVASQSLSERLIRDYLSTAARRGNPPPSSGRPRFSDGTNFGSFLASLPVGVPSAAARLAYEQLFHGGLQVARQCVQAGAGGPVSEFPLPLAERKSYRGTAVAPHETPAVLV